MSDEITDEQVHAAYALSKQVLHGEIATSAAVTALTEQHGMNPGSAQAYVSTLQHIFAGREYRRTVNAYATRYFLDCIFRDFGNEGLSRAIESLKKHANYYASTGKSSLPSIRKLITEYSARTEPGPTAEDYRLMFHEQTAASLADGSEERQRRLRSAPKIPRVVTLTTQIFERNPDVVAEVLYRAAGVCGRCRRQAPFRRARDQSPYLEVHHVVQLAHGGEDTIENAIALCPNCHREAHYG